MRVKQALEYHRPRVSDHSEYRKYQAMQWLRLMGGLPDEPNTGDWDAICAMPGIDDFFAILFKEIADFDLPEAVIESDTEDSVRHVRVGWRGNKGLGAQIIVVNCTETSAFPVYCDWETFGLPGIKVRWEYALEKAGQLGHVAYRHGKLECTFDRPSDQQRFADIWQRHIGKIPVFELAESDICHNTGA
jgi:hypothetical protein